MNKVFLFGTVGFIKIHEKCVIFSLNSRLNRSKDNNYINCLISGYNAKNFTDNIEKGDKVTVEGQLQIKEKDGKYYTTVIVDNLCSEKIKFVPKELEVSDNKQSKPVFSNINTITNEEDYPF